MTFGLIQLGEICLYISDKVFAVKIKGINFLFFIYDKVQMTPNVERTCPIPLVFISNIIINIFCHQNSIIWLIITKNIFQKEKKDIVEKRKRRLIVRSRIL